MALDLHAQQRGQRRGGTSRLLLRAAALCLALAPSCARVRPAERAALWHLYELTNGANWTSAENWSPMDPDEPAAGDPCRKTRSAVPYRVSDAATSALVPGLHYEPTPWYGVGCIDPCDDYLDGPNCTAGRVVSIRLRDNNLEGELTSWVGVGELRNLSYVDLSYNSINGSLPTEIGRVRRTAR